MDAKNYANIPLEGSCHSGNERANAVLSEIRANFISDQIELHGTTDFYLKLELGGGSGDGAIRIEIEIGSPDKRRYSEPFIKGSYYELYPTVHEGDDGKISSNLEPRVIDYTIRYGPGSKVSLGAGIIADSLKKAIESASKGSVFIAFKYS